MSTRVDRKSNIELLRCILILFVIVLHFNGGGIGNGMSSAATGSGSFYFLAFLESMTICAVDTFIFMSAFYLSDQPRRRLEKVILLVAACIGYQLLTYVFHLVTGDLTFTVTGFLYTIVPANYYVILYSALYLLSPYLNTALNKISKKNYERLLVLLGVLVVWEDFWNLLQNKLNISFLGISIVGKSGSDQGYTLVLFATLYVLAGYVRKYCELKKWYWYAGGFGVSAIVIFVCSRVSPTAWNYDCLFVVLESLFLFRLFQCIPVKQNKGINYLAKATFGVFCLHTVLFPYMHIPEIASRGGFFMVVFMIIVIMADYLICSGVVLLIQLLLKPLVIRVKKWKFMQYTIDVEKE